MSCVLARRSSPCRAARCVAGPGDRLGQLPELSRPVGPRPARIARVISAINLQARASAGRCNSLDHEPLIAASTDTIGG